MEKYSKQREEILEVIKESYDHPNAEKIYNKVKQKGSTASKGTVYRNLKLLSENGIIRKISMLNGPDRYDYFRKEHHHVVCSVCGIVTDFYYNFKIENLQKEIKNQTNVEISSESVLIEGICQKCKITNKK